VYEIVTAVQNAFRLEMNQNKNIYFLKIIFDINTSKRSENIKKFILNKKNQNLKEHDLHRVPKHTLKTKTKHSQAYKRPSRGNFLSKNLFFYVLKLF
jgi:hypothetical protein